MVLMTIFTFVAAFVVLSPQINDSSTELHNGILNTDEKQNCSFISFMVLMGISTVAAACFVTPKDFPAPKTHNDGSERTWTVKEDEATLENRLQDLKAKSDRILALEHRLNLLQAEYELQSEALENKFNEILAPETRNYRSFA